MAISASDISQLRAQTGAGMMDCKNALEEAGGNMEAAAELLRKKGIAKAAKRADKIAAEGRIASFISADNKVGAIVEVNCETDFVGKSEDLIKLSQAVAEAIVKNNPASVDALKSVQLASGETVEAAITNLTLKIGEKIGVRRFERVETDGLVGAYLHGTKIGVLVELSGGNAELATDVAMHIAAANPKYLDRTAVPTAEIDKEKEIYAEQLRAQGKPANIIENILKGKVEKYFSEICVVDQQFIKNEDVTVGKLLADNKVTLRRFVRYELGEGIEKKVTDFAAEVAEQLK